MNCKFCNEFIPKAKLNNHEIKCRFNPYKIEKFDKNGKLNPFWGRSSENQFTYAKNLGLPTPIISVETRLKIGKSTSSQKWSDKRRKNLSESMRKAVLKYPDSYRASNVNGRCKKIKYSNEITLDSSWELEVVNWFDNNSIKWERNKKSFPYIWNNKVHSYFPDFYLIDLDKYVEVKGYQRDRDLEKWKSLSNLIIIKKKEIDQIKKQTFTLKY